MVKKMKLPFLVNKSEMRSSSSWPWPSCHRPRTLSFRANATDLFNTINSDSAAVEVVDPVETVVRELRSDRRRLFFEPDESSSILETTKASAEGRVPFKDSFVLSMESRDPYSDFRKSMEEMVEAHALNHLEALQELLCWYLRVNAKSNHVSILAAFVDLLVDLAPNSSPSPCPSSPLSFSTSSVSSSFSRRCVNCSSLEAEEEVHDAADDPASTSASFSQVQEDIHRHYGKASSLSMPHSSLSLILTYEESWCERVRKGKSLSNQLGQMMCENPPLAFNALKDIALILDEDKVKFIRKHDFFYNK